MPIRAEIRLPRTADSAVTVDVTDGDGHWMTFSLDDLQKKAFSMDPAIVSSDRDPLDPSDVVAFMWDGWRAAKAKAIEAELIPPDRS